MLNSMVMNFLFVRSEIPFSGKFGTWTDPKVWNSMTIVTFSWLDWKYHFRMNTAFSSLFSVTTCHMKTRPYLGNLYLMKENEEKH